MSLATALRRAVGASQPEAKAFELDGWPWIGDGSTGWLTADGGYASLDMAVGLPAWLSVIRRLSQGVAMSPMMVYRGPHEARERAPDTWQEKLLHGRSPGDGYTRSSLLGDLAASFAATGNAYLRKLKSSRGRVGELMVLDPRLVSPRRLGGRIVFDDQTQGTMVTRGTDQIIHIRDLSFGVRANSDGRDLEGINPIASLRTSIGTGIQRQQWERAYFRNDARPGIALTFPADVGLATAKDVVRQWNDFHVGPENAGKAGALTGGADVKVIPPISLEDAQFVESNRLSLQVIAGLYGMPPSLAGDATDKGLVGEEAQIQFSIFALGPILTAIELSLSSDDDLFPESDGLFCEALPDALVRPALQSRYDAYRLSRQGGWRTANEIRALDNLPPHPDGDVLQVTPVGGESNPANPMPPKPEPKPDPSPQEGSDA